MRAVSTEVAVAATKIGGPFSTGADRSVQRVVRLDAARITFKELATMAWPEKTDSHLAHITRVDARTCRRWLSDQNEPPAEALGIILCEIMRRFNQRD